MRAAASFSARYGAGVPAPGVWNETLDLLLAHRSVRRYLPDALPDGALEAAIAAAQSASTSSNLQLWSVIAVEDAARKARLAALSDNQLHVARAPLVLAWIADLNRLRAISAQENEPGEGLDYLEAFLLAVVDAALAAQNAAIAFESLGLGCCYIGGFRNQPDEIAAELALPREAFALFGMTVGVPDPARPASVKPRLPQAAVLFCEQYDQSAGLARWAANTRTKLTSMTMVAMALISGVTPKRIMA